MTKFLERAYPVVPHIIQNLFVSGYNLKAYRNRHGGNYLKWRKHFNANEFLSIEHLEKIQFYRLMHLLKFAKKNSPFYNNLYNGINIDSFQAIGDLRALPIVDKEMIRSNIQKVVTIPKSKAIISKTGGTTGKSLEVYKTANDIQERAAMLDNFRGKYGYSLGQRTAWFSGKALLTEKDVRKMRFWKDDFFHNVRYYSTFHIQEKYLNSYLNDLIQFSPKYLVGFPSTISDIAKHGLIHGIRFPKDSVKAIFPTAETMTIEMRETIQSFFIAKVYDQYASSEGAPFIFECCQGNLHMDLQSGVFEVLDEKNQTSNQGRLVVTSFTSYGSPLIRYEIGDEVKLSNKTCNCGNNNPLVEKIFGRKNDHIFSPEIGRINLGNISNCLKGVHGVIKFQILQDSFDYITVRMNKDPKLYKKSDEKTFLLNLRDRVGQKMKINVNYVSEIQNEPNGKFRLVKNFLSEESN